MSQKLHIQNYQNFRRMFTVTTAQSFSDTNAVCYVFPVLWMTHRGAEPTAKYDVYDCLVLIVFVSKILSKRDVSSCEIVCCISLPR